MKQVVIVIPRGTVNVSSISGIYEVLKAGGEFWQKKQNKPVFELRLASNTSALTSDYGFTLQTIHINQVKKPDLLIIPSLSQDYVEILENNRELIAWIKGNYDKGAEIASICTGAFMVAATGLLNGKSCSTHWDAAHDLKSMFPAVDVSSNILSSSGNGIYTNGGGYSFLNLALFLVEKYYDRETAIFCSKMFQIDIDRISQSPFVIFKGQKMHGDHLIQEAQLYIENNIKEKISFEKLAARLAISRRNFDRRFIKATKNNPTEYLQKVKIEVAKNHLEQGQKTISEVMYEVGYTDGKAFRDIFKRITGLSPLSYKAKYNPKVSPVTEN